MREGRASWTARWVAWMRSLGEFLPEAERLVVDPYGARFSWRSTQRLVRLARRRPAVGRALVSFPPLKANAMSLQLRTRAIDDAVESFRAAGGRQIVILGAGFDARAARLGAGQLAYFEVDHPATQEKKRGALPESQGVHYVAWDFEARSLDHLPSALAAEGHRPDQPTLTIWEGVTMYLTPSTIATTVDAVRRYSATGSRLVFNYFDRSSMEGARGKLSGEGWVVRAVGEPFRFGWHPDELPGWMASHGFRVLSDDDYLALSRRFLGTTARLPRGRGRRIAVVEPAVLPVSEPRP